MSAWCSHVHEADPKLKMMKQDVTDLPVWDPWCEATGGGHDTHNIFSTQLLDFIFDDSHVSSQLIPFQNILYDHRFQT